MNRAGVRAMLLAAAAIVVVAAAFALGVRWADSTGSVQVIRELSGAVSRVSLTGSKVCLVRDSGEGACGVVMQVPGSAALVVGQRITVSDAWIMDQGTQSEVFILTSPPPIPSLSA